MFFIHPFILFTVFLMAFAPNSFSQEVKLDSNLQVDSLLQNDSLEVPKAELGSKEWEKSIWINLALNDEEKTLETVQGLELISDPKYYELLVALKQGVLYQYEERIDIDAGIVTIGEETENEEGDAIVPLYSVYPKKEALQVDGKVITVDPYDLIEIENNRTIRTAVNQITRKLELFHPEERIRTIAAESVGDADLTLVSLIDSAVSVEKNATIKNLLSLSKAKILIQHGTDDDRLSGVQLMGKLNNPLAIPVLEEVLKESNKEAFNKEVKKTITDLKSLASIMSGIQTLFIGISLSSILILVALGLAVIYGLMGVINMAHGEFMMIGAYTTFVVQVIVYDTLGDGFFWLALPFSFLVAGLFGILIEATVIRKLYNRPLESLLATWGISMLLIQAARSIFGDLTAVNLPNAFSGGWEISPQVVLPYNRLFIIGLTIFCLAALYVLFNRTNFGLKIRSTVQNRNMAACVGVKVRHIDRMTFFLGTGIAGVAGWAMTLIGNVVPNMGQTYIVDSFLVVVTGGVGKLMGTVAAGLGIGVTTKMLEPIFEAVYGKAIILGLIILFLQIKPTGIFPNKGRGED